MIYQYSFFSFKLSLHHKLCVIVVQMADFKNDCQFDQVVILILTLKAPRGVGDLAAGSLYDSTFFNL